MGFQPRGMRCNYSVVVIVIVIYLRFTLDPFNNSVPSLQTGMLICGRLRCSPWSICAWIVVLVASLQRIPSCRGNESLDGRFSFSLSTFDPSGKLAQVERAIIASSLGTPIVAVIQQDKILMASPQILPSPLMEDDGTTRFSNITPNIVIGHSGISADGRVLVAAAQQLAVEHAYTYDENIPIDLFLEEMSLLYQEYTMSPSVRPFGASLLVAYVPNIVEEDDDDEEQSYSRPRLFRLDPSGSVVSFDDEIAIVNGQFATSRSGLESSLERFSEARNGTAADGRARLSRILQEAISPKDIPKDMAIKIGKKAEGDDDEDQTVMLPSAIITASLTRQDGLEVERRKLNARSAASSINKTSSPPPTP